VIGLTRLLSNALTLQGMGLLFLKTYYLSAT
jgi:hypothetical protein